MRQANPTDIRATLKSLESQVISSQEINSRWHPHKKNMAKRRFVDWHLTACLSSVRRAREILQ